MPISGFPRICLTRLRCGKSTTCVDLDGKRSEKLGSKWSDAVRFPTSCPPFFGSTPIAHHLFLTSACFQPTSSQFSLISPYWLQAPLGRFLASHFLGFLTNSPFSVSVFSSRPVRG